MNWGSVENAFVATIKLLQRPDGKKYAELCEPYNGQFQGPWSLPEDFHPGKRYGLVQFQQGTGTSSGKGSLNDLAITAQVTIFVGSEASGRVVSKQDVYDMLDVFRKALHSATTDIDGTRVRVLWQQDALEFSEPNHICYSQTYTIQILQYRIDNGNHNG